MEEGECFLSLLEQREIDNNSHGYFGASEATIEARIAPERPRVNDCQMLKCWTNHAPMIESFAHPLSSQNSALADPKTNVPNDFRPEASF